MTPAQRDTLRSVVAGIVGWHETLIVWDGESVPHLAGVGLVTLRTVSATTLGTVDERRERYEGTTRYVDTHVARVMRIDVDVLCMTAPLARDVCETVACGLSDEGPTEALAQDGLSLIELGRVIDLDQKIDDSAADRSLVEIALHATWVVADPTATKATIGTAAKSLVEPQ